jgi:hypothetical protein
LRSTNACKVDHFVLAAPDLQRACDDFEATTGVRPAFGGAHAGRGTHNALVAFENGSYLEIIAPDPAQQATSMSQPMALLARPTLMHWAVRCSGTAALSQRLRELGWAPTEIQRMSRTPPNAAKLEWELFGLKDHRYGGLAPFFIDWFACPHPATTSPSVGPMTSVRLALPDPAPLRTMMSALGLDDAVSVTKGEAELAIAFDSRRGVVRYMGRSPAGFTLRD